MANGRLVGNAVGGDEDKRVIGLENLSDGLALLDWDTGQQNLSVWIQCAMGSERVSSCDNSRLTHERRSYGLLLGAIHDDNPANGIYRIAFSAYWGPIDQEKSYVASD